MASRSTKRPKPAKTRREEANGSAPPGDVLTLAEAAELLRITEEGLRRDAAAGRIPGRMVGGQWRFSREGLSDWLKTPERQTLADWFRDHPPKPWTAQVENEVEEEIAELYAQRRSMGTVGQMQSREASK